MTTKPKKINSLMIYLRNHHKIEIQGTSQKRKLRNIGYYHGFKGYRYNKLPSNRIPYNDFNQLLAIYEFDMELKALFYQQLMFIETALKNYALEVVLEESKTSNFNDIFSQLLVDYKRHTASSDDYKKAYLQRLTLRTKINNALSQAYQKNKKVIAHYYHKDKSVPIWAIFEVISLGEFGTFIHCLNRNTKAKISKMLMLNQSCDSNAELTQTIIYAIKDLRNAVAHNEIIFDTRFRSGKIGSNLRSCLSIDVGVQRIEFNNIVDYLILTIYLLKNLKVPKRDLLKIVSTFEDSIEVLRKKIPVNMYTSILPLDTRNKLICLKNFIKKQQ